MSTPDDAQHPAPPPPGAAAPGEAAGPNPEAGRAADAASYGTAADGRGENGSPGHPPPHSGDRDPAGGDPDHQDPAGEEDGTGGGNQRLEEAVRAVETALIEYEIAVESFRIEVENFARLHEERLGPLHARIEELDAEIAEATAARTGAREDRRRAEQLRGRIMPLPGLDGLFDGWLSSEGMATDAMAMLTDGSAQSPPRVRPGEDARKLYRELVRSCHPDLATDPSERDRRDAFVVRVNQAYARGDADQLRALADEWAAGPVGAPAPLTRAEELAARLEWLASRKESLARIAAELEAGAIGSMLQLADDDPDALLAEIGDDLRARIAIREAELARLRAAAGDEERTPEPSGPAAEGQAAESTAEGGPAEGGHAANRHAAEGPAEEHGGGGSGADGGPGEHGGPPAADGGGSRRP